MTPALLTTANTRYPASLRGLLGIHSPPQLTAFGNLDLLPFSKTALFCSARCPASAILRVYDQAARWRDEGRCTISGFHSPVEKECLRILLRGKQPIILCQARAIETMRIPTECRAAFDAGRLLFLSPFTKKPKRVTKDSALHRNQVVAALADEAYIAHVTPGGQTAQIVAKLKQWRVPVISSY